MPKGVLSTLRTPSPLSVDVSELLRHPGATKRLSVSSEVADVALPMARVPQGSPLAIDLQLDALVDGVYVSGSISGEVEAECRRCLTTFRLPARVEVGDVYLYPGAEATEEDDEVYRVTGEVMDLEPLVRDSVVLSLPQHPLCREDCAGLCPACGADRNSVDCGHRTERIDVRWSDLEGLRKQMED